MKHRLLYIPIVLLFLLSFTDCAKKGNPSGGIKDSIPPVIVKSNPENYSINFSENEIRIYFDEYIKLKDLQKELIVSPPLKYPPTITPLSTSKVLKIKIDDTLKENTTYSFNFGNSIVDNNEENAFKYFKYVFSTGSYIDSLNLKGNIRDALLPKPEGPSTVLLYEVNENFQDSLIYSEKPTYITTTTDSIGSFELTNLKEGNYLLLALKEKSNDYTFQPKDDKIAFADRVISLPTDSTYTLTLFKETPDYKIARPSLIAKNHIVFGYEGEGDSLKVSISSQTPNTYKSKTYRDRLKDTLHYWFKPALENDSLVFIAKNKLYIDTLNVRMRDLYKDSLSAQIINPKALTPNDTLEIQVNTPIVTIDSEKLFVMDKDSVAVTASMSYTEETNVVKIAFPKKEEQNYSVQLLPGAFTDFYDKENDTISHIVRTRAASDYGTIELTLQNANEFPLIVQLVDAKFNVVSEEHISENRKVNFEHIIPAFYYIRIIYDQNSNQQWDTGSFLQRTAPEKIVYYPSKIEVRANWSLKETFILK
tara:strand:- start:368 stop:1972 length:1605 start_codon:yes stop_codon:yes gene_type:complete